MFGVCLLELIFCKMRWHDCRISWLLLLLLLLASALQTCKIASIFSTLSFFQFRGSDSQHQIFFDTLRSHGAQKKQGFVVAGSQQQQNLCPFCARPVVAFQFANLCSAKEDAEFYGEEFWIPQPAIRHNVHTIRHQHICWTHPKPPSTLWSCCTLASWYFST